MALQRGKKIFSNPKKNYCTQSQEKTTAQNKKKLSFSIQEIFIRTNQNQSKSKVLFLLIFLLNIAFKPIKREKSQFPSQDYNQNGENPLKEESILHQSSISSSSSSVFLFNFILVFTFIFIDYFIYILIILLFFYTFMGGMVWIYGGNTQRPMVCHEFNPVNH